MQLLIGGNTKRSKLGQHAVEIEWNNLPDESQQFVIKYGLKQYLADGMAGAENVQDAKEGVEERVRKLLEADFGRSRGESSGKLDTLEARMVKIARQAVREKAKAKKVKLDKDQVEAAAAAWIERDPVKFTEEAQKQLDAEAETRERMNEGEEEEDIFALLGISDEDEVTDEA